MSTVGFRAVVDFGLQVSTSTRPRSGSAPHTRAPRRTLAGDTAGERVELRDGVLQIDRIPVPTGAAGHLEEPKEPQGRSGGLPHCENRPVNRRETCLKRRYIETLPGGLAHSILVFGYGPGDDTAEVVVPVGACFLLGDHRHVRFGSRDERSGGGLASVPFENPSRTRRRQIVPLGGQVTREASAARMPRARLPAGSARTRTSRSLPPRLLPDVTAA